MILKNVIAQIIDEQRSVLDAKDDSIARTALPALPKLGNLALIVSGIRRCGKSTLMRQLMREKYPAALFLNFEDARLYDFEPNDFSRLDEIIAERGVKTLFFDEIQVVGGWERYVRQKLDSGFQVAVTGSNASLLSRELGTKLTGRHLARELFPFSFSEFCRYKKLRPSASAAERYLQHGGFPEYLRNGDGEVLERLFGDILLRDVAVRYGIRDERQLQRLAAWLVANVGNLLTGNKLKTYFDIKSTSTMMEYLSHLEMAWLFFFVPKFSYSVKKQLINPRKIYAADTGLAGKNSVSFTDDLGRLFENMVFLHYRRQFREICYFAEQGECDFVLCDKGAVSGVAQACCQLTPDNLPRELNGLVEAMDYFNLREGKIITLRQKDTFTVSGKKITAVPFHELQ